MGTQAVLYDSALPTEALKIRIAAKLANASLNVSSQPLDPSKPSASICNVGQLQFNDANAAARYIGNINLPFPDICGLRLHHRSLLKGKPNL